MMTKKNIIALTIIGITVIILIIVIVILIIIFLPSNNNNFQLSNTSLPLLSNAEYKQNLKINSQILDIISTIATPSSGSLSPPNVLSFPPGFTLSYSANYFNGIMPFFIVNEGTTQFLSANTSTVYLNPYPTGSSVTSSIIKPDAYFSLRITNIFNSNNNNMFTFILQQFIESQYTVKIDGISDTLSVIKNYGQLLLIPVTLSNKENRFIIVAEEGNAGKSGCKILDISTSSINSISSFIFSTYDPLNITNTQLWNIFPVIPDDSLIPSIPLSSALYSVTSNNRGGDLFYIVQLSTRNVLCSNVLNGTSVYFLTPNTTDFTSLWYITFSKGPLTNGNSNNYYYFWIYSAWYNITQTPISNQTAFLNLSNSPKIVMGSTSLLDNPNTIVAYQPINTVNYNNVFVLSGSNTSSSGGNALGGSITPTIESLSESNFSTVYLSNDYVFAFVPAFSYAQ